MDCTLIKLFIFKSNTANMISEERLYENKHRTKVLFIKIATYILTIMCALAIFLVVLMKEDEAASVSIAPINEIITQRGEQSQRDENNTTTLQVGHEAANNVSICFFLSVHNKS